LILSDKPVNHRVNNSIVFYSFTLFKSSEKATLCFCHYRKEKNNLTEKRQKRTPEPLFQAVSGFMAEKEGFEPSRRV